jgi:uncharacterized protein YjbI with pentapeptide repeats
VAPNLKRARSVWRIAPSVLIAVGFVLVATGASAQATPMCSAPPVTKVNYNHCDLADANFEGANLTGAKLNAATVTGANLTNTQLILAKMSGVVSGGIVGTPASLPADWQLASGYLIGPRAYLRDANLGGAYLGSADLEHANLISADLFGTRLYSANLTSTNLKYASLSMSSLLSADLSKANLTNADLSWVTFTDANLTGAKVTGAAFYDNYWFNTTCPDGTNSNNDGGTCINNLSD